MLMKAKVLDGKPAEPIPLSVVELQHALQEAEQAHQARLDTNWPEFYAKFLIAKEWK